MKYSLSFIAFFLIALSQFSVAQTVNMGDAGYPLTNTIPCATFSNGSTPNFFDNGGTAGNYTANYNDTITFCPDLTQGTKVSLVFAINAGFSFDVHASDSIYVYDGPTTSSPLFGVHNSATSPTGFTYTATWGNPTGCITVVFISNGVNQGAGWQAGVSCGNINQPFEPHLEAFVNGTGPNAMNPIDSGFVNVCFGDSILFVAKPLFPNSLETTGFGYSQNVNTNIIFEWTISSGGTFPDNDSIWYTPPSRNGFLIDIKMTDIFPQAERLLGKVRVSQLPSFAGTGPLEDTVCLGQATVLIGGVTPTDTVGIDIPEGSFQLGGSFAGLTYLPDGSGAQYQAPITISGFPAGSTINSVQDLNQVCITMEHSYLGDLEIALQCPNGTQVALVNSYNLGFIPGGFNGGGTYLGDADDNSGNGVPGIGWEYCFSSVFNDWGNMGSQLAAGNTLPGTISGGQSMNPGGVYLPETTFAGFAGCPVNGNWTIIVQDNLGIDDGYIFEWGLFFDGSYFAGLGGYQNIVVNDFWSADPTIISDLNDTLIIIQPNVPGQYGYTYNIVDDYGCEYDTTVFLEVLELPTIFNDTLSCDLTFQVPGATSFSGGTWFSASPEISFSNVSSNQPVVNTSLAGTYVVNFVDNTCNDTVSATIIFPQYPTIFPPDSACNENYQIDVNQLDSYGGGSWSTFDGTGTFSPSAGTYAPLFTGNPPFNYQITFTDSICGNTATTSLLMLGNSAVDVPSIACFLNVQNITSEFPPGHSITWTVLDNPITPFLEDTAATFVAGTSNTSPNPDIAVSNYGTYTISYNITGPVCNVSGTETIYFPPYIYTQIFDTSLCVGVIYELQAYITPTPVTYAWNNGSTGTSIMVGQPGIYTVSVTNECYQFIDSALITYYVCDIEAPNVISLGSMSGNDKWFVKSDGIAEFNCTIVNRWGNLIYEFNNVNGFWDGRSQNGDFVEDGIYFYRIKAVAFGGREIDQHGFITVVK